MVKPVVSVLFFIVSAGFLFPADVPVTLVGITGQVEVKANVKDAWLPAREGMPLFDGMLIAVGFNSQAAVLAGDAATIIGSLNRAEIQIIQTDNENPRVVVVQEVRTLNSPSLVPPPPIGFGVHERVKLNLPLPLRQQEPQRGNSLFENAGFSSFLVLPKTIRIPIEIIFP